MPQRDPQIQKLIEAVGPLKCEVELPSSWTDYFDRHGPKPGSLQDRRRFPRSYLRTSAALEYRQSFPALPRPNAWYEVYTNDVSRAGISFLHGEELFPTEQMNLVLSDGRPRPVEVARCRRIQERCFEIGAIFITGFRAPAAGLPPFSVPRVMRVRFG